jgi:L-alanine-DL-glutamate epimerase-like enolase superfamily enzyme
MRQAGERLMVDANQAWSLDDALAMATKLTAFDLDWLEEPLRADAPLAEWQQLQRHCPAPLAAGENLRGEAVFAAAVDDGVLGVIQPDIGKWGGFSGCLPAMRRALAAGRRFCPHWLGGGIGLVASGHLLAVAGGDGRLEMDANPNPLRTLITAFPEVTDGVARLPDGPGLGTAPRLDELKPFAVA